MKKNPPISHQKTPAGDRLQLVIARSGIASRRQAANIITAGRVKVNAHTITEPGMRVNPQVDEILLDGQPLPAAEQLHTVLIYKPVGYICSVDNTQGRSVCDLVNLPVRLVPVGRLDKESEGLLLLSNDGSLINRMTHPSFGHKKTYHVTIIGHLTSSAIRNLTEPIEIDGRLTRPAAIRILTSQGSRHTIEITIGEGRNRQVRFLCARAGFNVIRLIRTAIGNLRDTKLKPGQWRPLRPAERSLLTAANRVR